MNDSYETAKTLRKLLPLVTIDKNAFTEAAEAVIEMSLDQMDHRDLMEFFYETKMELFRKDPTNLQCEMEYFTVTLDEPETDNDIIVPFKD
jgi:hypothetical protein